MAKQKKIAAWLKTLPEMQAQAALSNMNTYTKNSREPTLPNALFAAFIWKDSPEGHKYWSDIYNKLI